MTSIAKLTSKIMRDIRKKDAMAKANLKNIRHSRHRKKYDYCDDCLYYSVAFNECCNKRMAKATNYKHTHLDFLSRVYMVIDDSFLAKCQILQARDI